MAALCHPIPPVITHQIIGILASVIEHYGCWPSLFMGPRLLVIKISSTWQHYDNCGWPQLVSVALQRLGWWGGEPEKGAAIKSVGHFRAN